MTDTVIHHFIRTTPPITRLLVALTITVSLSIYFDFISSQSISYSRFYLPDLQFYRMVTTFFYYGKVSFELIMNFMFLYRYSSLLEESYTRMSDYFFTLVLIFISLILASTFFYIPFLATPLSNTITYIWSRKNPQGIVQIFGFVSFSAFFLPFVFPLISLIFEGRISKEELVGIVVGQIIFYVRDVYPKFGRNFFKTPCWVHGLFKEPCDDCKRPVSPAGRKIANFVKPQLIEQAAEPVAPETLEEQKGEVLIDKSEIMEQIEDLKNAGNYESDIKNTASALNSNSKPSLDIKEDEFNSNLADQTAEPIIKSEIENADEELSDYFEYYESSEFDDVDEEEEEDEIDYEDLCVDGDLSDEDAFACVQLDESEEEDLQPYGTLEQHTAEDEEMRDFETFEDNSELDDVIESSKDEPYTAGNLNDGFKPLTEKQPDAQQKVADRDEDLYLSKLEQMNSSQEESNELCQDSWESV